MSVPPYMRGQPQPARGGPSGVQPTNAQQIMQAQDEKIAAALQAQEYHRSMHPSRVAGGAGMMMVPGAGGGMVMAPGGGGGGGGHHHPHRGGASGMMAAMAPPGAMTPGAGQHDPQREARHRARDEQLKMALEVNPEAFVSVPMLYVPTVHALQ